MNHAILILAHNNFDVISALLEQADDPAFDIYIHINRKVKRFPREQWQASVKRAGLYFVPRVRVGYCDYSMVNAVVSLFRTAAQKHYDYYHLISGADLMIKKRDEFLRFFEEHNGKEFVGFSPDFDGDRVAYRHIFTACGRQKSKLLSRFFGAARKMLITLQKRLGLTNRVTDFEIVRKGTDWYSITDAAVGYLLKQEPLFRKSFFRAYCPTEFFPQTVLYNSPYCERLYDLQSEGRGCLRTIDWQRGTPFTFTEEDKDFLQASDGLFARKFDENKDMAIVDFFRRYVKE